MALKKTTSTAKTAAKKTAEVKAEPAKAAEKAVKAEPAKAEAKAEKAEPAKAIETKKDTTKKLETKAAVLVDTPAEKTQENAAAKKKTAAKKTAAKTTTKTTAKKTAAKKTTAKKTTAAAKKAADEKAEVRTEIFLQFAGKEYTQDEILQKVKDIWTYDLNNNVDDIKDVQLYLKPEESAAYYVVNGNTTGKIVL